MRCRDVFAKMDMTLHITSRALLHGTEISDTIPPAYTLVEILQPQDPEYCMWRSSCELSTSAAEPPLIDRIFEGFGGPSFFVEAMAGWLSRYHGRDAFVLLQLVDAIHELARQDMLGPAYAPPRHPRFLSVIRSSSRFWKAFLGLFRRSAIDDKRDSDNSYNGEMVLPLALSFLVVNVNTCSIDAPPKEWTSFVRILCEAGMFDVLDDAVDRLLEHDEMGTTSEVQIPCSAHSNLWIGRTVQSIVLSFETLRGKRSDAFLCFASTTAAPADFARPYTTLFYAATTRNAG